MIEKRYYRCQSKGISSYMVNFMIDWLHFLPFVNHLKLPIFDLVFIKLNETDQLIMKSNYLKPQIIISYWYSCNGTKILWLFLNLKPFLRSEVKHRFTELKSSTNIAMNSLGQCNLPAIKAKVSVVGVKYGVKIKGFKITVKDKLRELCRVYVLHLYSSYQ